MQSGPFSCGAYGLCAGGHNARPYVGRGGEEIPLVLNDEPLGKGA